MIKRPLIIVNSADVQKFYSNRRSNKGCTKHIKRGE